jgi:cytochrome P450
MNVTTPDLYSYISQSDHFGHDANQEAQLAVVAGADTNAITVTNALSLLCRHPKYQTILHLELKDLPTDVNGLIDDQHLVGKPCLSGIINEVLRLHPPVPSGMQRLTPPEGAMIAGRFIPGDMIVTTPTWSLQRG